MNVDVLCDQFERSGVIARYAAGTPSGEADRGFEDHYLTCARCQSSLLAGVATRDCFAAGTAIRRPSRLRPVLLLATAASLATIFGIRGLGRDDVEKIGAVDEAPLYLGATVRGNDIAGSLIFDSAMAAYNAGNYERALNGFDRLPPDEREPVVEFFSAASYLMLGQPRDAETLFTRVIAFGATPYKAEAHFYRAKARLQQRDERGAINDLREASAHASPIAENARVLLQQLNP